MVTANVCIDHTLFMRSILVDGAAFGEFVVMGGVPESEPWLNVELFCALRLEKTFV